MKTSYLEKLEFNKIKEILSKSAITFLGKDMATNLMPYESKSDTQKALQQAFDASNLIYRKGNIPIREVADISMHLKMIEANNSLSAKFILDLTNILKISRDLKVYFNNDDIDMSEFESLKDIFGNLYTNPKIIETIDLSIQEDEYILDSASSNLKSIRRNIEKKEQEIRSKLKNMIHQNYVQESIITTRNDRFVIPVKSEYRSSVKGFIHDTSSSGSTLFIEPLSVFELNNDINDLKIDENIEIQKILENLSKLFFDIKDDLENTFKLIGIIDFIFAKGKYANSLNATLPIITDEKIIELNNCFHPLIEENKAVKNTILLGNVYNSLIITGPNTGGKTVTLKTTGILCLMALSGLLIPAKEGSKIYHFKKIFADIGDEQSIQDSLSTFSSHMSNIAIILKEVDSESLVLLDELGSGTDPLEGSSLAISILEELHNKDCLSLITTHYPEIKHFALTTNGFENACVEFDIEKMKPTFKLLIGIPGTSNAFAISESLGISREIIERAKSKLKEDSIHIEDLLKEIYEDKRIVEEEKQAIIKNSKEAEDLKKSYQESLDDLNKKKEEIINSAKEKAAETLIDTKEEADELLKTIKYSNNSKDANNARTKIIEKINKAYSVKDKEFETIDVNNLKIGDIVFVPSINQNGTILSISKDSVILQIGAIKTNFKPTDLSPAKDESYSKDDKLRSVKREFKISSIPLEINVIGQNVVDACFEIDKYLDTCSLNGLNKVRIVHGKGTGKLRAGIHEFLKHHPQVKTFRLGLYGEGEDGVTIVELK